MKSRIVVVFHESFRGRDPRTAAVHHLAEIWREEGLDVRFAHGVDALPEADLALLHCDLSVVPEAYRGLTTRYPIALNGRLHDVRKSVLGRHRVALGDGTPGPVLVKTDLNTAGRPEWRALSRGQRGLRRVAGRLGWRALVRARRTADYRVFEEAARVPARVWRDPRLVVERFLPERTAAGYAVHSCYVLGDRAVCERSEGPDPIITDANAARIENVDPHPEVLEHAWALGLDYGKVDYTLSEEGVVILDVNKTVGASATGRNAALQANRRVMAAGIHGYLEGRLRPA